MRMSIGLLYIIGFGLCMEDASSCEQLVKIDVPAEEVLLYAHDKPGCVDWVTEFSLGIYLAAYSICESQAVQNIQAVYSEKDASKTSRKFWSAFAEGLGDHASMEGCLQGIISGLDIRKKYGSSADRSSDGKEISFFYTPSKGRFESVVNSLLSALEGPVIFYRTSPWGQLGNVDFYNIRDQFVDFDTFSVNSRMEFGNFLSIEGTDFDF